MIAALADAGAVLGERALPRRGGGHRRASCTSGCATATVACCARFNRGAARIPAYLEDHAFLLEALLTLYEATFDERWFAWARALGDELLDRFADARARRLLRRRRRRRAADRPAQGPRGHADPVGLLERRARPAAPRGADRRGALRGGRARRAAPGRADGGRATRAPSAICCARSTSTPRRCASSRSSAPEPQALLAVVRERHRPHLVLAGSDGAPSAVPLLEGRTPAAGGGAAAYLCERFACQAPVSDPEALRSLLDRAREAPPR